MNNIVSTIFMFFNICSAGYVVIVSVTYLIQLFYAFLGLRKYKKSLDYSTSARFIESENIVPISVLVPAFNEVETICDTVKNLLSLDYPNYEIIVINDGSNDETLNELIEKFNLVSIDEPFKTSIKTEKVQAIYRSVEHINLVVIDKENGGKADALNAGINLSQYPVFVSVDADCILEDTSLIRIVYSFMNDPDCVAIGGTVRINSGCQIENGKLKSVALTGNALFTIQTNEYLRDFLTGRIALNEMGTLLIISGAFGAFKKQAVIDVGGYTTKCIGEDIELVVKLHKNSFQKNLGSTIRFMPDPVCWTQPPDNLKDLVKQRKRWHIGLADTLLKHRDMILNPKYKKIGMMTLPYFCFFDFIGPVIEMLGYFFIPLSWALGILDVKFMLGFYSLGLLYGTILSVGSLLLEENIFGKYPKLRDILKLFFFAIIDNLGYRQIMTIIKIVAMFRFSKNKNQWGNIKRRKYNKEQINNP
jgi:cellulose synthase/poly-beta-1,6-N-acetylglucosamine synthase-like glycosyltransferase